jgi:hypothetical protein
VIVKMSKVAVIGHRDLLVQVLETIRQSATLQIDMDIQKRIEEGPEARLRPLLLDARALGSRLFYEDLDRRIDRLLARRPNVPSRESYLSEPHAITAIATVLDNRLELCEKRMHRREAIERDLNELSRYLMFLTTVDSLVPTGAEAAGLDVIAVDVRDPAALERLTRVAGRVLPGADVRTAKAEDGSYWPRGHGRERPTDARLRGRFRAGDRSPGIGAARHRPNARRSRALLERFAPVTP